ncbi:peptidoglycan-binding protein [Candidatus Uhrbacteria bacterium]|nr:peptidoglycan-binding protein [Candidatus Uhrbacteria bacterium]
MTLSKEISLVGSSASLVGKISVTSGTSSISGFDISNPDDAYGIVIDNVSNVSVTGNTVHDIGTNLTTGSAQAIYLEGSSGSAISNVTISGNTISNVGSANLAGPNTGGTSAKGIYVGDTASTGTITGLVISGNTISHVNASTAAWNVGRGAYGVLINFGGDTTATISDNQISFLEGLWAHGIGLEKNTPGTVLSGNTFGTLTDHKTPTDAYAVFFEANASMSSVSVDGATYGDTSSVWVDAALDGTGGNPLVSNGGQSYIFGVNAFGTVQDGIDAVDAGGTVTVAAGTYDEQLTINKSITLTGAGNDATTGTILASTATGYGATVSANDVSLNDIRIDRAGFGGGAQVTGTAVTNLSFAGVTVTGASNAVDHLVSPYVGLRVGSGTDIDGLTVVQSHFDGNDIGWYFAKESAGSGGTTSVSNIDVSLTTFSNNLMKGIYAEKMDDATFDNITIADSGTDATYGFNAGIDINLKWSAYSNITIKDSTITGSGLMGTASNPLFPSSITIKARDDASSYNSTPASLTGVTVDNVTVSGGVVGIRFGEAGKVNLGPSSTTVVNSSLSGTGGFGLANETSATITAESNWWGSSTSPDGVSIGGSGTSTVIFSPWYTDAAMTTLQFTTTSTATTTEATTGSSTTNSTSTTTGGDDVTVDIPASTTITGDQNWDGVLNPVAVVSSIGVPPSNGSNQTSTILSVTVGSPDSVLLLSQGTRLFFENQAGNRVGWTHGSTFTEITATCAADNQTVGDALADGADCKIDVGGDLVVWTRHFSTFSVYTESASTPSGGGGGGGGGGNGAPVASGGGGGSVSTSGSTSGNAAGSTSAGTTGTAGGSTGGQVLGAATYNFSANLTVGSRGNDVTELQKLLISQGFSIPAGATGYFGAQTRAAVIDFQKAHGITPAVGYVGPITRAELNKGVAPTMSDEQRQMLIQSLQAQLAVLVAQLAAYVKSH